MLDYCSGSLGLCIGSAVNGVIVLLLLRLDLTAMVCFTHVYSVFQSGLYRRFYCEVMSRCLLGTGDDFVPFASAIHSVLNVARYGTQAPIKKKSLRNLRFYSRHVRSFWHVGS